MRKLVELEDFQLCRQKQGSGGLEGKSGPKAQFRVIISNQGLRPRWPLKLWERWNYKEQSRVRRGLSMKNSKQFPKVT